MAESQDDKDVDTLVDDLQSVLDRLKKAQGKDVQDEDSESEPKDLSGAEKKAHRLIAARKASEKSESGSN